MKKLVAAMVMIGGFAVFGVACNSASPQTQIICSTIDNLAGAGDFLIVQGVSYTDTGTGGSTIPLSNGAVKLYSTFPDNAPMCAGNCIGKFPTGFTKIVDTTTTNDGVLIYTVHTDGTVLGHVTPVFGSNAPQACQVQYGL